MKIKIWSVVLLLIGITSQVQAMQADTAASTADAPPTTDAAVVLQKKKSTLKTTATAVLDAGRMSKKEAAKTAEQQQDNPSAASVGETADSAAVVPATVSAAQTPPPGEDEKKSNDDPAAATSSLAPTTASATLVPAPTPASTETTVPSVTSTTHDIGKPQFEGTPAKDWDDWAKQYEAKIQAWEPEIRKFFTELYTKAQQVGKEGAAEQKKLITEDLATGVAKIRRDTNVEEFLKEKYASRISEAKAKVTDATKETIKIIDKLIEEESAKIKAAIE